MAKTWFGRWRSSASPMLILNATCCALRWGVRCRWMRLPFIPKLPRQVRSSTAAISRLSARFWPKAAIPPKRSRLSAITARRLRIGRIAAGRGRSVTGRCLPMRWEPPWSMISGRPMSRRAGRACVDRRHMGAGRALVAKSGHSAEGIEVVGYHGQTVAHRPDRGWTWQIGDGQVLADALGATVVDDFRSADVAQGGQGAPLVPVYHAALLADLDTPAVVLNLGGVGNVTFVGSTWLLLASATGPGDALLEDWMRAQPGRSHHLGDALAEIEHAVCRARVGKTERTSEVY